MHGHERVVGKGRRDGGVLTDAGRMGSRSASTAPPTSSWRKNSAVLAVHDEPVLDGLLETGGQVGVEDAVAAARAARRPRRRWSPDLEGLGDRRQRIGDKAVRPVPASA